MYLLFDTETTGLPKNYKAPVSDSKNWPRMVQLAWQLFDKQNNLVETRDYIIKPEDYKIPADVSKIHGITTEMAIAEGADLQTVLTEFANAINKTEFVVAHNFSFDEKIVGAEFYRKNVAHKLNDRKQICTMKSSTNYCKLPGNYGFKWPNLSELHQKLFNKKFVDAHRAGGDVEALAKCFFELKKLGVIKD